MSISLLEKAISLTQEAAEASDYFGMNAYSEEEQQEAIIFIYDKLVNIGEAKTIEWLYSEGILEA